jgi:hypothetical protein
MKTSHLLHKPNRIWLNPTDASRMTASEPLTLLLNVHNHRRHHSRQNMRAFDRVMSDNTITTILGSMHPATDGAALDAILHEMGKLEPHQIVAICQKLINEVNYGEQEPG